MPTNPRIIGLDVARSLAIFIMVFVNFQMVLAKETTQGWLPVFFDLLHGKGAALFVILAGAGISLMLKSSLEERDSKKLWIKKTILLKRAAFLFVFGLLILPLWPADILHFYGFFIPFGVLVAQYRSRWLWSGTAVLVLTYPFVLDIVNYDAGWDWEALEYEDLWTPVGFIRNLFINGFHPVIPWVSFIFSGIWLGRQALLNRSVQYRILLISGSIFVLIEITSHVLVSAALSSKLFLLEDAIALFGTQPMPPLPLYMASTTSLSFIIIILCIIITEKFHDNRWLEALMVSGQLALTHYVLHIMVGMLSLYLFFGERNLSLTFTFCYALGFCIASAVFSIAWQKHYSRGPMSWLMRHFSG